MYNLWKDVMKRKIKMANFGCADLDVELTENIKNNTNKDIYHDYCSTFTHYTRNYLPVKESTFFLF